MKIQDMPVDKVIPYERNPRNNKNAVPLVMASLKEYGFQQPIVVDKENVIIVGHTRFQAAMKLGMEKVPVTVADKLTDAQIKAYRIMDNRSAEKAIWDDELLALELGDLDHMNFNLDLTGLEDARIKDLLGIDEGNQLTGDADISDSLEGQFDVVVACKDEQAQVALIEKLMADGYECRAVM